MKIFITLFISSISFLSYGQENTIRPITIALEYLSAPLVISQKETTAQKYKLLEVDLSVNLREQYLRKNKSMMYLPEKQYIQPEYNVAIPQSNSDSKVGFTISGNGYNSNLNTTGGIKNTAYKDASLYSGAFCPITGLAY